MTSDALREAIDDPAARAAISATELVEALLHRIEAVEPLVGAYFALTPERALADAACIDARRARGERLPLDGMPVAVKDNIDVAGVRCTVASKLFEHRVPNEDAEVVRRLRAAGGIVIGKAALHELVYGATCTNPFFPQCRNPWDLERIPGGSSGGSGAALAADLCIGALGSDTGGSVRIPAHLNGVSALRPTYGAISGRGAFPIAPSFDSVGPMARSVRDVAALYAAIAGYDPDDPRAVEHVTPDVLSPHEEDLAGLRVGIPREFFWSGLDDGIDDAVRGLAERLEALGAELVDISIPSVEEAQLICTQLIRTEALALHETDLARRPEAFSSAAARRLALGRDVSGVEVSRMTGRMYDLRRDLRRLFSSGLDLLLTPTAPAVAPPIEGAEMIATTARMTRFAYPWSVAALPVLSLPCGVTADGLPVGAQLAAAPWHERLLVGAGLALQDATDWHRLRPPALDHAAAATR